MIAERSFDSGFRQLVILSRRSDFRVERVRDMIIALHSLLREIYSDERVL